LAASGAWACYAGEYSEKLTQQLSQRFDRERVQLCCSGTIGVEIALRGCNIGPGDEVILAAYDFPGNFRAIEATGARVVLVDIGAKSWTIESVAELEQAIRPETKGILVSHLHGTLAPMRTISEWAATKKLALIEDACQVPGATVDGKPAGSWGDVSILSFGGSKLLSAGRGGAVMTNDLRIDQRMRIFRDRGNDAFAMSELQAAVLEPQLARLDSKRARHAETVRWFESQLTSKGIQLTSRSQPIEEHSFYKWGLRLVGEASEIELKRVAILARSRKEGLAIGAGFRGFMTRGTTRCRRASALTNATAASLSTIVVHHTALNKADAAQIVRRLNEL
jgi:perosamine synthetase